MARSKRKPRSKKRRSLTRRSKGSALGSKRLIAGLIVYLAAIAVLAVFRVPIKEFLLERAKTPPAAARQEQPGQKTQPPKRIPPVAKTAESMPPAKKDIVKKPAPEKPSVKAVKKSSAGKKLASATPAKTVSSVTPAKKAVASLPVPAAPVRPGAAGPILVFVIDDVGNTLTDRSLLAELGRNVTYAILPELPHSRDFAEMSRKTGAEVILHLPMEAINGPIDDPGKISPSMSKDDIMRTLKADIACVPYIAGVNNHKGSLATADSEIMTMVLSCLKERGLFFLDSFTSPGSVACDICRKTGMPVLRRDIFLDNSSDPVEIKAQIDRLLRVAQKKGYAIAIGHYRPNTLRVLVETLPKLISDGYQIRSLSQLIEWKQDSR